MTLLSHWRADPLFALLGERAAGFLDDVFEQDYLLSTTADPHRFDGLVTIDDVDEIVTSTDLREGDLVLAHAGRDSIDQSSYIDNGGFVDRGAVARHYRDGATIILNQAQRIVPTLGELCHGLEHVFSCHLQTNLYLTPPGEQGFRTHFDNHDVFVIQVQGKKDWRLYGVPLGLPFRGEHYQSSAHAVGDLRAEFTLDAGDCLYVPRGMMHDASTAGDAASLHITVGLINKTWADLILEAVSEVALREPAFRRSLPPGYATEGFDRAAARDMLVALGQHLAQEMRLDPAMDLMVDDHIRTRAALNRQTITQARRTIADSDHFVRAPMAQYRIAQDGEALCVIAPGGELNFAAGCEDAVRRALSGEVFALAELEFAHAEEVTRRLMDYGLVLRA